MRPSRRPPRAATPQAGQSLVEFALLLALIAVVALPAVMFLQQVQLNFYAAQQGALNSPALPTAPAPALYYVIPSEAADCEDGGLQTVVVPIGNFASQDACEAWVATHSSNAPRGDESG